MFLSTCRRSAAIALLAAALMTTSCAQLTNLADLLAGIAAGSCDETSSVRIRLVNTSADQFVAPNVGVCPNGMAASPHYFAHPTPVLGPGEEITYTSCQIASIDGNCDTFSTDFAVGLCGWRYGASTDALTSATRRFGGQIGFQFSCGDTIILRWTDSGNDGGTWTSEVEPATGNTTPAVDFQEIS